MRLALAVVLLALPALLPGTAEAIHVCGQDGAQPRELVEAHEMVGSDHLHRYVDNTPTAVTYRFAKAPGSPYLNHVTLYVDFHDAQGACRGFVCDDVGGWFLVQCTMPAGQHVVTVSRSVDWPAAAYVLTALCGPLLAPC